METGDILIVDADSDDREMIADIAIDLHLPNKCRFFSDGDALVAHLSQAGEAPFIILSEVRLPKINGFELRDRLLKSSDKRLRSVPFIFWSVTTSEAEIERAYELSAHGFFVKPASLLEMEIVFKTLLQYWRTSRMPAKKEEISNRGTIV